MAYDLVNLIPELRLRIGDINPALYRYTDDWLEVALKSSVKILGKWWNFKYLLDSNEFIMRNTSGYFIFDETSDGVVGGVLEPGDDQIIIIYAAIITLEGSLENSAWDYGSWKDAEISYSNIASSKTRGDILKGLWEELTSILKVPQKRLAGILKGSLPGYLGNSFERVDNY